MKRHTLIFILLLLLGCSSTKYYLGNSCNFNSAPYVLLKSEKVLNVDEFHYLKANKDTILNKTEVIEESLVRNERIISNDRESYLGINYQKKIKYLKSNVEKHLIYNSKGVLIRSYLLGRSGDHQVVNIGKYLNYNELGEIAYSVDYEKGYNICWEEALAIAKKIGGKEIRKYKVKSFIVKRVSLYEFPNENPIWIIGFDRDKNLDLPDEKRCGKYEKVPYFYNTKYCKIDGQTGEIISFSFSPCVNVIYDK